VVDYGEEEFADQDDGVQMSGEGAPMVQEGEEVYDEEMAQ
jgi:hypothetical protein